MKQAWYESSVGATVALLLTHSYVYCDLYTITLVGGATVIRYCTGQINVAIPAGNTWNADLVFIDQDKSNSTGHWKVGTGVDTWQTVFVPRPYDPKTNTSDPDTINGLPWLSAARAGALDGADVQIDRAFFATWPTNNPATIAPTGVITLFKGLIAGVDVSRTQVPITILSYLSLLTVNIPRNTFQNGCRHTLFDTGCTLTAATFAKTSTVAATSTQNQIKSSVATPSGSASFTFGRITFTSGQNSGFSRAIKYWDSGANIIYLIAPMYYTVTVGDAFTAYPGCNKSMTHCTAFSNLANFGGQPYIPASTAAL